MPAAAPADAPAPSARPRAQPRSRGGVLIVGVDRLLTVPAKCCKPAPPEPIIGFVTRGRGVSVHRADCANAGGLASQAERLIEVDWDHDAPATYVVSAEVEALDRSRLLRDVANTMADHHVNILACSTHTGSDRISKMRFDFELGDPSHLESVIGTIKQIDSVYDAYRVLPGKGG